MLAEGEQLIGDLISRKLREKGYYVVGVKNGEEVLDTIRQGGIDLVLIEATLPILNGFDVLGEMRAREETKSIPSILIFDAGSPQEIKRAKDLGVRDWVVKTEFDPKDIVDKVTRCIGQSNASA